MAGTLRQDRALLVKFDFLIQHSNRPTMGVLNVTPFLCAFQLWKHGLPTLPRKQGSTAPYRELLGVSGDATLSVDVIPVPKIQRIHLPPHRP